MTVSHPRTQIVKSEPVNATLTPRAAAADPSLTLTVRTPVSFAHDDPAAVATYLLDAGYIAVLPRSVYEHWRFRSEDGGRIAVVYEHTLLLQGREAIAFAGELAAMLGVAP